MASYSVLSPPSAFLMMRWMLSLGTFIRLALLIRSASLPLEAGSGPPLRTATLISRPILVKTLARAPSVFSFLRLMLFHLLCPDIGVSLLAVCFTKPPPLYGRSEEHTSELQSRFDLVCRLLLEKQ